jgi:uncharacterized secreted protein with C-terminal beta-propeller domain
MNGKVSAILMVATVATALLQTAYAFIYYENIVEDIYGGYSFPPLKCFESYAEIEAYVEAKESIENVFYTLRGGAFFESLASLKASTPEYSVTNVQVEGVDEADIVKTDGEYIYAISRDGVVVVKAYPPKEAMVAARIKLNGSPQGLFITPGKLVAILSTARFVERAADSSVGGVYSIAWEEPVTEVTVYDLGGGGDIKISSSFKVDGLYISSRMIGDYVYIFTSQQVYRFKDEVSIPGCEVGGVYAWVDPRDIYYVEGDMGPYSYTNILAVDIVDGGYSVKSLLVGYAGAVYVSKDNIYLAVPKWSDSSSLSTIYRIAIDGLEIRAEASVDIPGVVLNQFSMDEYNGYFRVATSTQSLFRISILATRSNPLGSELSTNVYIARVEDMAIVGRLEGLAPGENIHSARFIGDRCYLVTFKKVDPFFVIDLSTPSNPRVLGYLKIPGYSDYLHPYGESYLIGIGKETVEAEGGDFAWYQGVKISLFDIRNISNPVEAGKYVIGDRGTDTPVLRDHKALLVDYRNNLMVFPVLEAKIDPEIYQGRALLPYAYGEPVWQGAYILRVSDAGIDYVGRITHIDAVIEPSGKKGEELWRYSEFFVKRALYIDDILYTISDGRIKMNRLSDLSEVAILDI